MPPVLPFALIVCLVASTLPTPAQARTDPPPVDGHGGAAAAASLLATAIARQADRLVVEREKVRSRIGTAQQSGASIEADWSGVRSAAPGTEIMVIVKGGQPATRLLLGADGSDLTVLNLDSPSLPTAAKDLLRDLASNRPPGLLAALTAGTTFVFERKVGLVHQVRVA